ncbi:MAG: hypothetical protein ABJA98_22935 [Acidobacteriota bacterium]
MKTWLTAAGLVVTSLTLSPSLSAQWPIYPTRDVPSSNGKPNLDAPAPRTADGKPDLTGLWENVWFYNGKVSPPLASPAGEPPASTFSNVGAGFKDGLPLRPWAAELLKQRKEQNSKDNPDAHCLPMGLMQFHEHPQPRKIVQTPDLIVILYEGNAGVRQIFTDGRALPQKEAQPWWYGYSVGKWEGDTLVVETIGFRDEGWLDIWGSPLTDAAKITERFQRLNYGTLRIDVTIDDPKAYTQPFTVRVNQRVVLNNELIEFICAENERSVPHMIGK